MGRVDLELSDRRLGRRRRTRQKHLGCLLAHARTREERRYGRHRLRPLPPLARRYRSARTRQFFRLSVFDRVVAHSAVGRRRGGAARARLLRASGRWAHRERGRAVALPLPLGPAAGAAGEGRLAQSRYFRNVRRAAERFAAMWNGACLDPLMTGAYPAPVAADFAPLAADGDLRTMRQPIDYLGVNYYAPMYVMHAPQSLFGAWFGAAPAGTR